MQDRKKLLFVINSLGCGGAEKSLVSLLPLIDYEKYDVCLQMFQVGGMFMELLPKEVHVLPMIDFFNFCNRRVKEQFGSKQWRHIWARICLYLTLRINHKRKIKLHDAQVFWKTCAKAIDESQNYYDVAIAWGQGNPTHYVAEKVKADRKLAWVNADYLSVGHNKEFDKKYYKNYDGIVTVSDRLLETMKKVFPEFTARMNVIKDIQNEELIEKMAQERIKESKQAGKWRIVTVGRLVKPKGYDILVDSCKLLLEKEKNFEWFIVGEGPERAFIEKKIQEYGLQDNLFLLGAKSNPYPYMKSADIYVQTSRYEGYCLTIAEARTLNIPVVTTDFDVVYSQMINGKNGLVVSMNAEAVANGIECLIEDDKLRNCIIQYLKLEKKGNKEEIIKFYRLIAE